MCMAQSCPTSPPGSSVHGILQARILEWVAISSSRGSSQPWDWTHVSCIDRRIPCHWATGEAHRTCRLSNLSCPLSHVAWKPAYSVFGPQAQPLGVSVWPTSWRPDSQSWVLLPSLLISPWTSHIAPNVRVLAPAYVCSCSRVGPRSRRQIILRCNGKVITYRQRLTTAPFESPGETFIIEGLCVATHLLGYYMKPQVLDWNLRHHAGCERRRLTGWPMRTQVRVNGRRGCVCRTSHGR